MVDTWKKLYLLQDLLLVTAGPILMYFVIRRILSRNDATSTTPNPKLAERLENILADRDEELSWDDDDHLRDEVDDREHIRLKAAAKSKPPRKPLELNTYEQSIASEVIHPAEIPVSFEDIGGLDDLISDLQESVIYPLTLPHLYANASPLLSAPSGVLLYGPPGCGKTMLAKALAHESGAVFINLHISTLTEKWYGDSNKLVAAVFSLARKLQPAIVFIDEIDAVLGTRRSSEHEASGMVKAEFMTHWDGLASANAGTKHPQRILMLGATNRPEDIDEAILRRMPKKFAVGLPDSEQRKRIFQLVLKETKLDVTRDPANGLPMFDLAFLVQMSAGMSGSDIKEACREAAMEPVREYIRINRGTGKHVKNMKLNEIRGLRTQDFLTRMRLNDRFQKRANGSMTVEDSQPREAWTDSSDDDLEGDMHEAPEAQHVQPEDARHK